MIAEPYICIKGAEHPNLAWQSAGRVQWFDPERQEAINKAPMQDESVWVSYADFEREKLRELGNEDKISIIYRGGLGQVGDAYMWTDGYGKSCKSEDLIGYSSDQYINDSESNRLLKRAEFLKAVCGKEGVEWLLEAKQTGGCEKCGSHNTRLDFRYGCTPGLSFSGVECRECGHFEQHPPHYNPPKDKPNVTDVSDMKPGDKRDIFIEGKKVGTLEMSENSATVVHEMEPERDYYTKAEIDDRMMGLLHVIKEGHDKRWFVDRFL